MLSLDDTSNSAIIVKYYTSNALNPVMSFYITFPVVLGITSDKKYLIQVTCSYSSSSKVEVFDLTDTDNKLTNVASRFPELSPLKFGRGADTRDAYTAAIANQITYDPQHNLLWSPVYLYVSSSEQPYTLRYNPENETFTVVNIDYTALATEAGASRFIGFSGDLDAIWFNGGTNNRPIKLAITKSLGNYLIKYANSSEETITGTAAESISVGASGNVYLGDKGALQSKVATSNGTVTPSEGYYGLSKVTVNVVGTGAEVEGKNYTGAVINEGDKVWINPTYTEEGTVQEYFNSQNDSSCFTVIRLNENYTFDFKRGRLWNNGVLVGTAQSGCYNSNSYNTNGYHPVFAPDGVVYVYNGTGMQRIDSGLSWYKTSYSLPIFGTSEYILDKNNSAIVKIDPSTGNEIKRYTTDYTNIFGSCISAIYYGNGKFSMKVSGQTSGWWLCILDESTDTFSHTNKDYLSNLTEAPIGITSDYKYVICGDNHVYDVSNIENGITDVYTSKNFPAQIALYQNGLYFNGQTDMFCGCGTSSNGAMSISDSNKPEVVYYNKVDGSFTKLPLVINPTYSGYYFSGACISNGELVCYSVAQNGYGQYVYSPYLTTITGNNIVPFSQIVLDTQTGIATESIATGGTGTVKVGAKITPTGSITLTNNGTYNVMDYATAIVDNPNVLKHWYNWKTDTVIGIDTIGNFGESVAYGNDTFVGVTTGNNYVKYKVGSQSIAQSTLPITAQGTNWGPKIAYGNERFIIILGTNSSDYLYSDDGINWSQGVFSDSYLCQNIVYGNRKFIITIGGSSTYLYSSDGLSWTTGTLPKAVSNTSYFNNLSFANNKFIIVADSTCMYSDDGINWSTSTVDTDTGIYCDGSIYVNGVYVVIRNYGITGYSFKYYYSSDLSNWSSGTLPSDWKYWDARIASNGRECLMTSYNNQKVLYSTDGINWRQYNIFAAQSNNALFVADNSFYAVRVSNAIKVIPFYSTAYTLDEVPTTSSVVYSAPNTQSSLTVTTGGSAQITLSDENVYYRNTIDDIQEHLPTGSITITENGTHDVTDYAEAIVNVSDVPAVVESLSITPSTSQQTFTPGTGVDGYAPVNVSAVDSTIDENIVAGNIKKDVTILGVTGTLEEGPQINNQNISVTTDGTYTADSGYTGLGTVTVTAGAVASSEAENQIAEQLMLINDGQTTFTLNVTPVDAEVLLVSTTNSVNITPTSSSDGTYVYDISMDSSKSYSYSVSKTGYETQTGVINSETSQLSIVLQETDHSNGSEGFIPDLS